MRAIFSYFKTLVFDSKVRFNFFWLLGLLLNFFYVVINIIFGIKYENAWLITVALYHVLVAQLRFFSVYGADADKGGDRGEVVGFFILVLTVPMTAMIIHTVLYGAEESYPRASLPIFLVYVIVSIIRAVYGIVTNKKTHSDESRMNFVIKLSLALLSLFNLQSSLFYLLGVGAPLSVILNFSVGGAMTLSMLAMAKCALI